MTCTVCKLGRIWECAFHGKCGTGNGDSSSPDSSGTVRDVVEEEGPVREVHSYKSDASLRDQQSTGRKRAAIMYPLDRDADCEWKLQKYCGGGSDTIFGCLSGKQEARHHGPDKNTLNNDSGNVHRICHRCHNRWHARNDDGYVWGSVYNSHSPVECNPEEVMMDELNWLGIKIGQVTD